MNLLTKDSEYYHIPIANNGSTDLAKWTEIRNWLSANGEGWADVSKFYYTVNGIQIPITILVDNKVAVILSLKFGTQKS